MTGPKKDPKANTWTHPQEKEQGRRKGRDNNKPNKEFIEMIVGGPEGRDTASHRKNWARSLHVKQCQCFILGCFQEIEAGQVHAETIANSIVRLHWSWHRSGRPGINKVRAIISMANLCRKLYTLNGIGEERGDQKNVWSCYLEAVKKMNRQFEQIELVSQQVDKGEEKARIEPDANTELIHVDASSPERKVRIRVDLQEELRTEIVQINIEYHPRTAIKGHAVADFLVEMTGHQEEEPTRAISEPWWSMSVDGASGPKGYGGSVVFTTPRGFKVYHALIFNFKLTNNEAEYEALIGGLRLAKTLQITCLRIKSDSILVVGHINGNMEAKGEKMQRYRDLARALLKDLTEYVMEQILRGENIDADMLSKLTQAALEHVSKLARIETL
ncbi:unnamed protein product [Cuscuta campestris]|uniref:RNase H type-1 domain-containing protein n=1 Tax=Cuscuta campestris TaxID=132261 RepID=A0A484MAI1_9ASTE|nr:unnamed protein product [Cuscuta campestris]